MPRKLAAETKTETPESPTPETSPEESAPPTAPTDALPGTSPTVDAPADAGTETPAEPTSEDPAEETPSEPEKPVEEKPVFVPPTSAEVAKLKAHLDDLTEQVRQRIKAHNQLHAELAKQAKEIVKRDAGDLEELRAQKRAAFTAWENAARFEQQSDAAMEHLTA